MGVSNPPWRITRGDGPIVAVALHDSHELSADVRPFIASSDEARRREEDPYTGYWTTVGDHAVVAQRSRFELDLNRSREHCVYLDPAESWGLDVWSETPPTGLVARLRRLHDRFYADCEALLSEVARRHRRFVVLDLHAYNHRRAGPDAAPADRAVNPEINLGTASVDMQRWGGVVARLTRELSRPRLRDRRLDVRENVRFLGGYFPRWVNARFGEQGCAIALEIKKFFMDEWTEAVDWSMVGGVRDLLQSAASAVREAL